MGQKLSECVALILLNLAFFKCKYHLFIPLALFHKCFIAKKCRFDRYSIYVNSNSCRNRDNKAAFVQFGEIRSGVGVDTC